VPQPGNAWRIKDEIRAMALFKKHNLMDGAPGIGRFDIIFARNVAIYFNDEGKKKLCAKISQSLEPDGAMIIGATESLAGVCTRFESKRYLRYVFYQLKQAA
jgi:chemotaxis protein methyltransferase CheR